MKKRYSSNPLWNIKPVIPVNYINLYLNSNNLKVVVYGIVNIYTPIYNISRIP